jgi:hypothetical protein
LIKGQKKQKKNPKNKDQTEINLLVLKKNHKFDLNDKIKNYERFDKRAKKKKNENEIARNK